MRRQIIAGILASVAVLSGIGVPRAAAHTCAGPVVVDVGQPATINIGVTVEEVPVVGVDVTIPDGFRLERVVPVAGWRSERVGNEVRYRGGAITPFTCGFFTIGGVATEKATLAFPLTLRHRDGSTLRYTSQDPLDPASAQLVYAGTEPDSGQEDDGGRGGVAVAGIALVVIGIAGAALLLLRRR